MTHRWPPLPTSLPVPTWGEVEAELRADLEPETLTACPRCRGGVIRIEDGERVVVQSCPTCAPWGSRGLVSRSVAAAINPN
jgi:hypothetical protein